MFTVVIVPTEDALSYKTFPAQPTLEELQGLVGGYVEVLPRSPVIAGGTLLVNEEGLIRHLPYNDIGSALANRPICGPVVWCLFDLE